LSELGKARIRNQETAATTEGEEERRGPRLRVDIFALLRAFSTDWSACCVGVIIPIFPIFGLKKLVGSAPSMRKIKKKPPENLGKKDF
jgi:hypothetical protein